VAAAQGTQRLTLDRALALALEHNPQLQVAAALREGADAGVLTARAYPNPEMMTLMGPQFSRPNALTGPGARGLLQHYSIHQPIELPSVRSARIQTAQAGRESSVYALREARLVVRAMVKQAFFQVLRRRNEITLATENLRLIEDLRRRIQVQVEVGEAARLELIRAEAEVATARTLATSAQLRYTNAVAYFRTVVGAPLGPNVELDGQLETRQPLPGLESLREEVASRHPSLAQAQAEIRRAESRLRTEQAMRRPAPTAHSEFEHQPDLQFYRFGISLPLPIWNKREGPIGEAAAGLRQANALADLRRLEINANLERAYGMYEVATQQLVSFEDGVLREADAAVKAAEAAYRFGERGIIDVLDAQRVLRTVRLDYLSAQYDLQAALIEIEQLRAVDPEQK
jgi:cobalt-zinc-cadmium efflux system outer membrane protein